MVDLFLDYVKEKEVESQIDNISKFIIDCANLEKTDNEFKLLEEKFKVEFQEDEYFQTLSAFRLTDLLRERISTLHDNTDVPSVIGRAIFKAY